MGWLSRWKKRHSIQHLGLSGGILLGDIVARDNFKIKFEKSVREKQLEPSQIFNVNKTGLYYKLLSRKKLVCKIDSTGKGHKERKSDVAYVQ